METQEATTVHEAVRLATNGDGENISFSKVTIGEYDPKELHDPDEDTTDQYAFYNVRCTRGGEELTGQAIRNISQTHGRPVAVELPVE
jgi:hypothetical protein